MRTLINGVVGVLLGLTLLGGMVAVAGAQGSPSGTIHPATHAPATAQQSAACAGQDITDTGGADSAPEAKEATTGADTDNIDLQCGDQTGPDNASTAQVAVGGSQTAALDHGQVSLFSAQIGHAKVVTQANQTSPAASSATSEQESVSETEMNKGPDTDTLNVSCQQQGQQQGDNVGC